QLGSSGIWYTRTTGIWQTVWLEPAGTVRLTNLDPEGDPETRVLSIRVKTSSPYASLGRASGVVYGPDGKKVADLRSPDEPERLKAVVQAPKLWTPETPALYDLVVTYRDRAGRVLDEVRTYAAFRKASTRNGRLTLNGKPYFYRGVLDQGFWPDGIYTAPSD